MSVTQTGNKGSKNTKRHNSCHCGTLSLVEFILTESFSSFWKAHNERKIERDVTITEKENLRSVAWGSISLLWGQGLAAMAVLLRGEQKPNPPDTLDAKEAEGDGKRIEEAACWPERQGFGSSQQEPWKVLE